MCTRRRIYARRARTGQVVAAMDMSPKIPPGSLEPVVS
jgi:hypothetical protein